MHGAVVEIRPFEAGFAGRRATSEDRYRLAVSTSDDGDAGRQDSVDRRAPERDAYQLLLSTLPKGKDRRNRQGQVRAFTRPTLCHSAGISCRCVSVCLSVARRYYIETSARFKLFLHAGSLQLILRCVSRTYRVSPEVRVL